jgi:hypothetical protein
MQALNPRFVALHRVQVFSRRRPLVAVSLIKCNQSENTDMRSETAKFCLKIELVRYFQNALSQRFRSLPSSFFLKQATYLLYFALQV